MTICPPNLICNIINFTGQFAAQCFTGKFGEETGSDEFGATIMIFSLEYNDGGEAIVQC